MIGSVKDKDEGAKPCWCSLFALVTDRGANTANETSALSPAESFKDARILKLLGCGAFGGRKHSGAEIC
jgi:hypothetical protein